MLMSKTEVLCAKIMIFPQKEKSASHKESTLFPSRQAEKPRGYSLHTLEKAVEVVVIGKAQTAADLIQGQIRLQQQLARAIGLDTVDKGFGGNAQVLLHDVAQLLGAEVDVFCQL